MKELEQAEVVYVLQTSRDGSVAKPRSMLNKAIFDPWQRSLFSRQRTPGKEPLLAEKSFLVRQGRNHGIEKCLSAPGIYNKNNNHLSL